MAFQIFPDPQTAAALGKPPFQPLGLGPHEKLPAFAPLPLYVGPDPDEGGIATLFVGLNFFGATPVLDLVAGDVATAEARVCRIDPASANSVGSAVALYDGVNPTSAALSYFASPFGPNVYLIKIVVEIPGTTLSIRFANPGDGVCSYIWVAADNAEETRQPWLNVMADDGMMEPAVVSLDAYVGQSALLNGDRIWIENKGSGPVTLVGFDPPLPAPYVVRGLPLSLAANSLNQGGVLVGVDLAAAPADLPPAVFRFLTRDKPDPGPFGPEFHFGDLTLSARIVAGNLWSLRKPAAVARRSPGVAATRWGEIYVFGGVDPNTKAILKSVEAHDAESASPQPDMATARMALGVACGRDGWIYAIGGGAQAPADRSANEAFNPATREWRRLRPMPTPRQYLAVAAGDDGLIYAIGGCDFELRGLDVVEAYDPATDSWTSRQPLPSPRGFPAATTGDDGLIYVAGGENFSATGASADLTAYNPRTGAWTPLQPMSTARFGLAFAAGRNGKLYAAGGLSSLAEPRKKLTEEYDPATDAWRLRADMNVARANFGLAADAAGRLLALFGDDPHGVSVEQFTP